LDFELLLK